MARNRVINPEFWLDEEIAKISAQARLLYIGLWSICDDNYATFPNRHDWIKAQVFPYEEVDIKKLLLELSSIGKIVGFKAKDGKSYWFIKNFFKYQRVDRPSKPRYPWYSKSGLRVLVEPSLSTRPEEKRREEKLREDKLSEEKASPPSNKLEERKGKPFYRVTGEQMRLSQGKWWVIPRDGGKWLEFAGKQEDIIWKI